MKLVTILMICGVGGQTQTCDIQDYYWRDYDGSIPPDALVGGKDIRGNPTYIGQHFFWNGFVSGNIKKDERKFYFVHAGREWPGGSNNKILCSLHPERFNWINTNNTQLHNVNAELVRGGHEGGDYVYIGRKTLNGETSVGWIPFRKNPEHRNLHCGIRGKQHVDSEFEAFIYNRFG